MLYRLTPLADVRCVAGVVTTLAFAMVAGSALAQKADRPELQPTQVAQ